MRRLTKVESLEGAEPRHALGDCDETRARPQPRRARCIVAAGAPRAGQNYDLATPASASSTRWSLM